MDNEEIKKQISKIQRIVDILRRVLRLQTQLEKMQMEEMVRRIAKNYRVDEETLVAVIWAESGMNPNAINKNQNGTVDYGLCQFNDYWYRDIISPDTALKQPEIAVNVMCRAWERGRQNDWIAYRTKAYLKYLKVGK